MSNPPELCTVINVAFDSQHFPIKRAGTEQHRLAGLNHSVRRCDARLPRSSGVDSFSKRLHGRPQEHRGANAWEHDQIEPIAATLAKKPTVKENRRTRPKAATLYLTRVSITRAIS